jgi:hypothetical protein
MNNQVFEEAPANVGDSARQLEKQARQLAYDTRWHVKKQLGGKPVNAATMERLLLQRLQKSTAIPAVKARAKEMLVGKINKKVVASEEAQIQDLAADSLAKTLYKVFVEGASVNQDIKLDYLEELFADEKTKYKVRVTDVDKGTSYIRFATRDKITELRQKGLKVEKTEHGDPREDEAKQGAQTASALGGGTSKKDYDGDGKIESGAKEYRGAVHNAIQRKRGGTPDGQDTSSVKEEFIGEINSSEITSRKITGTGVDNSSLIKVFPEDKSSVSASGGSNIKQGMQEKQPVNAGYELSGSFIAEKAKSKAQQRFMGMVYAAKKGEMPDASPEVTAAAKSISTKEARKFAKTKHKGLPVHKEGNETSCEKDPRSLPTERELIKNKLRAALGVKNPVVMTAGYEPDGKQLDEFLGTGMVAAPITRGGTTIQQHQRKVLGIPVGKPVPVPAGKEYGARTVANYNKLNPTRSLVRDPNTNQLTSVAKPQPTSASTPRPASQRPGVIQGLQASKSRMDAWKETFEPEGEMSEAWYSGRGSYRTTASGRRVRRDEDSDVDMRVSDALQRQREARERARREAEEKKKN